MADDQPPTTGTTVAATRADAFVQALTFLTGEKFKEAVNQYLAAQVTPQARELLRVSDTVSAAVAERIPLVGPPLAKMVQEAALALVTPVQHGKQTVNAQGNGTASNSEKGADPVELANGQLLYTHTDLSIAGAGITFSFTRTYRSRARNPNGPMGVCWDHNYNVWLREVDANVIVVGSGELREDRYHRVSPGGLDDDYFAADSGQHSILVFNSKTQKYELHTPEAITCQFEDLAQFDAQNAGLHRLERVFDRFQVRNAATGEPEAPGNYLLFRYDATDVRLLASIEVNHPTRLVTLDYDDLGHIVALSDYSGRQVIYEYDDYDDLTAVTLPATQDRELGRTTFYEYSSATGPLQHMLTSVVDADGRRYLDVEYGMGEGFTDFERVVRQRDDEGEWLLSYCDIDNTRDPNLPLDPDIPISYTLVVQPNGHQVEYWFNQTGQVLFKSDDYVDSLGGRQQALWRNQYNPDGQQIASLSPEGVFTQRFYARDRYMLENGAQISDPLSTVPPPTSLLRLSFGNVLATVRRQKAPMPLLEWPSKAIADGIQTIGADDIVQQLSYQAGTTLPATVSDPRATKDLDSAPTNILKSYAYSADEFQFPLSVTFPATTDPDGTPHPQVQETFKCDANGRIIDHNDAEGHTTHTDYWQNADHADLEDVFGMGVFAPTPISLEGYPKSITVGSGEPNAATTQFKLYRRGTQEEITDPRLATTHIRVDATDEPIETTQNLAPGVDCTVKLNYTGQGKLWRSTREIETDLGQSIMQNGAQLGPELRLFRYSDTEQVRRQSIGGLDLRTLLTTRDVYTCENLPSRHFSPGGSVTRVGYDNRRLATSTTEGYGTSDAVLVKFFYDRDGRKTATLDGRGRMTRTEYDGFGRVARVIQVADHELDVPDTRPLGQRRGHTRITDYDKLDNVVLERFFEWRTGDNYWLLSRTSFEFDERGRKVKEIQDLFDAPVAAGPAGLDAFLAAAPATALQIETWLYLSPNGRVTEQRRGVITAGPAATPGSCIRYTFDYAGRELSASTVLLDAGSSEVTRTETTYDGNGNAVRVDRYDFEYDAIGNLVKTEVISRKSEFDNLNRRTAEIDGLGNRTTFHYDSRNLLIEKIDPLGNSVAFDYDIYGRQTRITERPAPGVEITSQFEHDADGQTTAIIRSDQANPAIVTNRYRYNAAHRKIEETLAAETPSSKMSEWRYDSAGDIVQHTMASGLVLDMDYDVLGKLASVKLTSQAVAPNPPVLGALKETFVHDGLGRLVRAETDNAATAVDIDIDSLGRATTEVQSLSGEPPLTISRRFDSLDQPSQIQYPSGRVLQLSHDLAGRLQNIQDVNRGIPNVGTGAPGIRHILARSYVGMRRRRDTLTNAYQTVASYDGAGRAVGIDHQDSTSASVLNVASLYNAAGDVLQEWQVGPQALTAARRYGYDGSHRLTNVASSMSAMPNVAAIGPPAAPLTPLAGQATIDALFAPPNAASEQFVYDSGNNRILETVAPIATPVDRLDQLVGPTYDDCGNPVLLNGAVLSFDAHNHLVSYTSAATAYSAVYDALGRRVATSDGAKSSRFFYDGVSDVAEYHNGQLFAEAVVCAPPDGRIHLYCGGKEFALHTDRINSVRMASDSLGAIAGRWDFSPYGSPEPGSIDLPSLRHRFMGREWDGAIALYHFRARHYDARTGRFLQRDPEDAEPGRSAYQAFKSSPLVFSDPHGTTPSPNHTGQQSNGWLHNAWEWFKNDNQWPPGPSWMWDPPQKPVEIDTQSRILPADPSHRVIPLRDLYDDWTPSWKWESPDGKPPLDWNTQLFVGALPYFIGVLVPEPPMALVREELQADAQAVAELKTGFARRSQTVNAFIDVNTRERFMVANSGSPLTVAQSRLADELGYVPLGYRVGGVDKLHAEPIMQDFARLSEPPLGPVAFETSWNVCKNCQLKIDWKQFTTTTTLK